MNTYTYKLTARSGIIHKSLVQIFRDKHRSLANYTALIEEQRQLTFAEFWQNTDAYTKFLQKTGIKKGQVVAIVCPMPSIDVAELLMACLQLEVAPLIINLSDKFQKLEPEDGNAYGYIVHKDFQSHIPAGTAAAYGREQAVGNQLLWLQINDEEKATPTDAALLVTSSGSTNSKKIIKCSAEGILSNIRNNITALGIRRQDRTLMVLPLTYSYGLIGQFLSHFFMGSTVVFSNKWLITNSIIELISRYQINSLFTVPPIFRQVTFLLERFGHLYRNRYSWSSLRYITVGGNHIESSAILKALKLFDCPIVKTYGLAEAGPRIATNVITSEYDSIASVGYPLYGVQVSALSDEGAVLPDGAVGSLLINTPSVSTGYLHEHANGLRIEGRNVYSHDIGCVDKEGKITILGRKNGMIWLPELEPIWQNELADIIYGNFYVLKLKMDQLENGRLNIDIAPMPNCKFSAADVLNSIGSTLGKDVSSHIDVFFPKINQIKLDK